MQSIEITTKNVEAFALSKLGNYPAGSVSKREVVATVPCAGNAEELGWELNGRLTKAVYDYWQQAQLDKPPHYLKSRDELTKIAQDMAQSLSSTSS